MQQRSPRSRLPRVEGGGSGQIPGLLDRAELKGRVTLLNDVRELLRAALGFLGHSLNSTDPAQPAAARNVAIHWKANIAKFANEQ